MQRALPNPRKKLFPVKTLQLPAVVLAAPLCSLALVSLCFLYIQNIGIFPKKPLTAAASSSEGAPARGPSPCIGLRSHELGSSVLAQTLSRSPWETSVITELPNSHAQGFRRRT